MPHNFLTLRIVIPSIAMLTTLQVQHLESSKKKFHRESIIEKKQEIHIHNSYSDKYYHLLISMLYHLIIQFNLKNK